MSNFKAECRKFQPNIFNKIKCSNCFRQREEHTAEALESNRASRKVSKCGYLFVAPDWDFSNPLNRTKRWQRRWFVLFDDGELTYSVDDLPATIPQGVIDMNRVLEVSEAEDVTGNQFALAITSPDRATFVKGTCREESRWWRDVLSVFPRQHGRHKRNATFPGIKSSSVLQTRSALARTPSPALASSFDPSTTQRVRFHSCTSDSFSVGRPSSAPTLGGQDDVFPMKDASIVVTSSPSPSLSPSPPPIYHSTPLSSLPPSTRLMRDEHKENTPPYLQDYHDHPPTSESPPTQDKVLGHRPRTRRTAKREARGLTHPRTDISHQLIISDMEDSKREEKLKDIADSITRPRETSNLAYKKKEGVKPTREKDVQENEQKVTQHTSDDMPDSALHEHIRGDPDGCGLEGEPLSFPLSTDIQRVDLPAEDVLYIKKGWLMKQGLSQQEWSKHWFVLQGNGLRFYRDPSAEDNGILDGIIDLGMVKNVEETEVGRNYGFRITTWDDKKYVFSAVTSGIRSNWVHALRNAANLKEPQNRPLTLGEKLEREIVATKDNNSTIESIEAERDATTASLTSLGRSFVSSDEDFKTASDSFFKDASREDLTNYDRLRSRSNSRVLTSSKRSRSSPPSSRRGTRDDFPSSKLNDSVSCFSETDSIPSIQDLDKHETPEKDSNGTATSTGESMLVDLLETQVESLKAKLEQTQINDLQKLVEEQEKELNEKNNIISKLEVLRQQFQEERQDWIEKVNSGEDKVKELNAVQRQHSDVVRKLTRSLQEAELKVHSLNQDLKVSASGTRSSVTTKAEEYARIRSENIELNKQITQLTMEVTRLKENLKSEKSEVYKWKDLVKELRSLLDGRNEDMESKRDEVMNLREKLKSTQNELDSTADRLVRGIEENECLCNRVRELERHSSQGKVRRGSSNLSISSSRERFSSRRNLPRMDSLSDLTNFDMNLEPEELEKDRLVDEYSDLRIRFEKAVNEIKAIKREVREAQSHQDDLELINQMLQNEIKSKEEDYLSQIRLMSTRIQDLTNKLTTSEKQVRSLKQKMSRAESKERRRTLSLKGKESFTLSKDMESKLSQLESRVESMLNGETTSLVELRGSCRPKEAKRSQSFEESTKASRLRRKSLDGSNNDDAMKAIVRMNDLETKVAALSGKDLKKLAHPNVGTSSTLSSSSNLNQSQTVTVTTSSGNYIQIPRSRSPTLPSSPVRSPLRSPSSPRKAVRSPRLTPEKLTKITRSDSEPKIWKEKLTALEKVFNTLQTKLTQCITWAGSVECSCSCGSDVLPRLQQQLTSVLRLAQSRHLNRDQNAINKLQPLTLRLHELLKEKISQLMQRRHHLKAAGKWTRDAQLKCFAERLAFETLLLSQLAQSLQSCHKSDSFEASLKLQELIEAHRKLSFLEKKLTNPDFDMDPMTPLEFYTSLLAEKLVVQGDVISSMAPLRSQKSLNSSVMNETCKDLQLRVLERERNLANIVTQYKEEKLFEIAVVMARETVTGTQPSHDDSVLLEELRLREAWVMAQDIITQELVNLEASQSILRLSHLLGPNDDDPSLIVQLNVSSLERLHTGAEESLRQEIEESVFTLSNKYEEVLAQYRSGSTGIINSVSANMESVLNEFAAVIAQKALIDGQLAVATGDENHLSTSEPLTIVEERSDPLDSATDVVASESHLLMFLGGGDSSVENLINSAMSHAEFSFVFNKVSGQCVSEISEVVNSYNKDHTSSTIGSLKSLNSSASDRDMDTDPTLGSPLVGGTKIPPSPKSRRRIESARKSRRVSDITGMVNGCRQCEELRQELNRLKRSLDTKKLRKQEAECKKCIEFIQRQKHLEEDHRNAMEDLRIQHQAEIDRLRDQVKYDPPTRDSDDELTELKRRLCLLEEGYEAQISALKKQYQEALGSRSDVCEENIRQRYQLEIEHLRDLCEKGLNAMESSHRRHIMDLEEKHRREMTALQAEKEEALAEETQATLAALDAMRKAHEAEVLKEVSKFKEEFLRRTENGLEGAAHSRLHEGEMRDVRREILALSEKYSEKCLEMAAKEQKLEGLQRQLSETKSHSRGLEERNRHLKQKLISHISHLKSKVEKTSLELQHQHECELALKDEEISRLNQILQKSKTHESDLGNLCGQLGQFLKTEQSLRTRDTSAIRDRLENHILTAVKLQGDGGLRTRWNSTEEQDRLPLEPSFSKEVTRSPSCPGLSGFSPFSFGGSDYKDGPVMGGLFPSPLMGMVALRKKIFEAPTSKAKC